MLHNSLDIMEATKISNRNVTHVSALQHVFNVRDWISPYLEPIKYHTEPHIFLFKKNPNRKAAMYYKQWAVSKEWEPDNNGCLLLKVYVHKILKLLSVLKMHRPVFWPR